jgi:hypothetical protein
LCNLHTPDYPIAAQHQLKAWSGFQRVLHSSDLYPKPIPRDLYDRPQRAPAQADSRRCSCEALVANYAGFGGSSILHYDYKRDQTSVREIRKFHLSARLVQDQMVWQADVFEMGTKRAVVAIGDRQKYFVADRLSCGIRPLARLHDLEVFGCHKEEPGAIPDAAVN